MLKIWAQNSYLRLHFGSKEPKTDASYTLLANTQNVYSKKFLKIIQ